MSSVQGPMLLSVEEENEALLDEIIDLLESPDCESPEVLLLIGRSGAGKSALINTLHKILTGKYYEIAKHGSGEVSTVTMDLNRYKNCGVKLHRITDKSRSERIKDIIPKLPHIMDCAGLADESSWKLLEILQLLAGGYITPGTSIVHLESLQEKYGKGYLRKVFDEANPEWKVTKIVFLQGCIDAIPRNLIDCLKQTLAVVDEETFMRKYRVGIFVLITKYDLVKDANVITIHGTNREKTLSLNDLEKVETALARQLNFEGAVEYNSIRWVSLTDSVGHNNPHVENIALKFLKRMVEPGVPDVKYIAPVMSTKKRMELNMHIFRNKISNFFQQDVQINFPKILIFVAIMVAMLAVICYLLNQTIEKSSSDRTTAGNSTN